MPRAGSSTDLKRLKVSQSLRLDLGTGELLVLDRDGEPELAIPGGATTEEAEGAFAKFACETEHLPDADRAEVGGWKSTETLRRVYDGPDQDTMLRIVMERGELREATP